MDCDYLHTYFARIKATGNNQKQAEYNMNLAKFDEYVTQHQSSTTVFVDGIEYPVAIVDHRQDASKLTKKIQFQINTPVNCGSLIIWEDETWIAYQKDRYPNQTSRSFYMIRCNYTFKWFNEYGVECSSPAYVVSSENKVVRENFRTWNNMITPQLNQYLEIMLPYKYIKLGTRILLSQRAWYIIENDNVSVPGIAYITFGETKIDKMDDDTSNSLADAFDHINYSIYLPYSAISMNDNEPFIISPIVYREGIIIDALLEYSHLDSSILVLNGNTIQPLQAGKDTITISLKDEPQVQLIIPVEITTAPVVFEQYYLQGNDVIKVGTNSSYAMIHELNGTTEVVEAIFHVDNTDLVDILEVTPKKITLRGNMQNKLGKVILSTDSGLSKVISITSLW